MSTIGMILISVTFSDLIIFCTGPFQIQRQQPFEDRVVRQVSRPAVSGGYRRVKLRVAVGQPGGNGKVSKQVVGV